MALTAIENIRRMRYAVTILLCICSGMAGFYWAHVLELGTLHIQGHGVLISAFIFTLAALVFVLVMETLALRAVSVAEKIRAINDDAPGKGARVPPDGAGVAKPRDEFPALQEQQGNADTTNQSGRGRPHAESGTHDG